MSPIQYYLFANAYIIVFWVFYRVFLKNTGHFGSIRLYLNSALILSLLLPFLQMGFAEIIGAHTLSRDIVVDSPIIGIFYSYNEATNTDATLSSGTGLNWRSFLEGMIFLGALITSLFYLINHLRIISILRHSEEYPILVNNLRILKSDEVDIPFIYRDFIVLPATISEEETPLVIEHEALHHQNGHRLDNMLFSVYHMIFWINPFFHLLKAALKLNHEYQVDRQILSSGKDPLFYKLSLIKYSVGLERFSLANQLSNRNIKNRIIMINSTYKRSVYWRYILLLPVITLLLSIFCLACVQPKPESKEQKSEPGSQLIETLPEAVEMEIIDVSWEVLQEKDKDATLVLLMNRNSEIMIASDKYITLENAEDRIISEYKKILEAGFSDPWVQVHKDVKADPEEYQKLLDAISGALFQLRKMYSEDQIPFEIYRVYPDKDIRPRPIRGAQTGS